MKIRNILIAAILAIVLVTAVAVPVFAVTDDNAEPAVTATQEEAVEDTAKDDSTSAKAIAAAIAIALASGLAALGMGLAIAKATDSISRQPEASDNIRTTLMLGLVFIETAIIYALIVAILIVFVL